MPHMSLILAHLLFAYITLATPWAGRWFYLKLKRDIAAGVPDAKLRAYRRSVCTQWLRVFLVLGIAFADPDFSSILQPVRPGSESMAWSFVVFFVVAMAMSALWYRYHGNRQFERLRQMAGRHF